MRGVRRRPLRRRRHYLVPLLSPSRGFLRGWPRVDGGGQAPPLRRAVWLRRCASSPHFSVCARVRGGAGRSRAFAVAAAPRAAARPSRRLRCAPPRLPLAAVVRVQGRRLSASRARPPLSFFCSGGGCHGSASAAAPPAPASLCGAKTRWGGLLALKGGCAAAAPPPPPPVFVFGGGGRGLMCPLRRGFCPRGGDCGGSAAAKR